MALNIGLITDILLVTPDQIWLMIKIICKLWSTGGLHVSKAWCYLPDAKNYDFSTFYTWQRSFFIFFFGRQEMLNKGWNFFWRSSTTPTKNCGSWLPPPLHNLALSSCRSWFFKFFNYRLSTLKSNLGILMLSNCHEILDGGSTWCKEATVKISSKSDKVKGGKSIPHGMKWI